MATFWREVLVPALRVRLYIQHLQCLCPWGPPGAQTAPGVPQTLPAASGRADLHPQVTQVSCNTSSTAFNWEHSRPCLILSLSLSFPALWEPWIPRWVSLWPSPAKNSPPPCKLRVILPHPDRWGDCGDPAPGQGPQLPSFPLTLSVPCSNTAWIKSRAAQVPNLPILPPKLLLYKISLTNWWKHYGFQKGYSWLRVKAATNATLHSAAAKKISVLIFQ